MEEALRAQLLGDASVAAIVDARVHWIDLPDRELPAVRLLVVGGSEGATLTGSNGLFEGRVQVDCFAGNAGQAIRLGRAVENSLQGLGSAGFRGVWHVQTRQGREGGTNTAARAYRVSLDFSVNWRSPS